MFEIMIKKKIPVSVWYHDLKKKIPVRVLDHDF